MRIEGTAAAASMLSDFRGALSALSTAVLLAGCAMALPVPEADRAKIRKVAIAVADFPPNLEMRIQTGDTGAVGKVQAAVEENVTRRLEAGDLREPLIEALRRELAAGEFQASVLPRSEVRTSADILRAYQLQAKDVDAVLEVSLRSMVMVGAGSVNIVTRGSNELLAGLGAATQVRVIDSGNQRLLGDFKVGQFSGFAPLEDWMAKRGGRMDDTLEQLSRRLAADIVDQALREYTPPEPRFDGEMPAPAPGTPDLALRPTIFSYYPIHALRPVSLPPQRSDTANTLRPRYGAMGAFTPVTGYSNRPTLEWERFPRVYAWAPERADAARISGVTYEIRLYNALRRHVSGGADYLSPERVIYERAGLAQPVHRPETELEPCAAYFWTARARFVLDGRVRVTPWMSVGPWRSPIAFATTPAAPDGKRCSYED